MNGELPHLVLCFWGIHDLIRDKCENGYGQYPLLSTLINVFCVQLYREYQSTIHKNSFSFFEDRNRQLG